MFSYLDMAQKVVLLSQLAISGYVFNSQYFQKINSVSNLTGEVQLFKFTQEMNSWITIPISNIKSSMISYPLKLTQSQLKFNAIEFTFTP